MSVLVCDRGSCVLYSSDDVTVTIDISEGSLHRSCHRHPALF